MVKDYMSTMRRLHKREIDERLGELSYQLEQERHFKPLIESHKKVVKQIGKKADEAEAILPKKEEMDDDYIYRFQWASRLSLQRFLSLKKELIEFTLPPRLVKSHLHPVSLDCRVTRPVLQARLQLTCLSHPFWRC